MGQLQGSVQQVNKSLATIAPPKLTLDTTQAEAKAQQAQNSLGALAQRLLGIPAGKVTLDTAGAEQGAAQLQKTLQGLLGAVGVNVGAIGGLTAVLGAGGLAAAAGVAVVGLAALGAEFKALDRAVANTTGLVGAQLDQMRTDFDRAFRTIPADSGQLVKAMANIRGELGLTGEPLVALTADLNAFTRVMGGDLATNTREVVGVFNAWQVATADQKQTLQDLTTIAQRTQQDTGQLFAELTRGAQSFQALGLTAQEAAVFLDAVGDAGIPARAVFSTLREAMNNVVKAGGDSTTTLKDLIAAIAAIEDPTEQARQAGQLFGEAYGPTMARLIRTGRLSIDEMVESATEGGNALEGSFAKGQTAAAQFALAVTNLKDGLREPSKAVLEFAATIGLNLVASVNAAGDAIDRFMGSSAVQAFVKLQQTAANLPGAAGAAQTALNISPLGAAARVVGAVGVLGTSQLAEQTQATNELTAAEQKLGETHEKTAGNADKGAAALNKMGQETKSLADQIKAAGEDTTLIESLLAGERQSKTLTEAIENLTDRGLAAFLAAERNAAEQAFVLTGSWERWDRAVETAETHLAAAAETTRQLKDEQAAADKAAKEFADTLEKAANVGVDQYQKRLEELANAVMPNLDAATAVSLKQALLLDDQMGVLGIIAQATGKDVGELDNALTHASQSGLKQLTEQSAAASKSFDQWFTDEVRSRTTSGINGIVGSMDAFTAASVKAKVAQGDLEGAIAEMAQAGGLNINTLRTALEGVGAAAQQARAAIAAAQTFQQTGVITPAAAAPTDARKGFQQEIQAAQEEFRQGQAALAQSQTDLDRAQAKSNKALNDQQAAIGRQFADGVERIKQARETADTALTQSLQNAATTLNRSMEAATKAIGDAWAQFNQKTEDAQVALQTTLADAAKGYGDTLRGLQEQSQDLIESATRAQQDALRSLADQMRALNQQFTQQALDESVRLQQFQATVFGLQPGAAADTQAQQLNRLREQEVAAAARAGFAAVGAQQQFAAASGQAGRQMAEQQKALEKALQKNSEAQEKAGQAYDKTVRNANDAYFKATRDASDTLTKVLRDEGDKRAAAVRASDLAQSRAFEKRQKEEEALNKEMDKLVEQRNRANQELQEARRERERDLVERQRELQEQDRKLQEALRRKTGEAEEKLQRAMDQLNLGLAQLDARLEALPAELVDTVKVGVQQHFNVNQQIIQETSVDFLQAAHRQLQADVSGGR